ncbi:tetratricopeptide repeat protein [Amycolatopsis sp. OK19-0408]|uniref:Tetratricopeptide repeat protein n=1 Tax=Amycolatopsis iheyensis TaxID=2945988 RepID=A0A9X2NGE9_9PSEU|nr:tetratricopeptide repeat protein [Amycolatopsis iheyensis]MCR6488326.1 tetratricopeptide repeat protein [Amycolatopsis iheyensis]
MTTPVREAEQAASVAVVIGPGGVGKTALAVQWASSHTSRFPDGQLYVDLRGFSSDSTAVTPVDALGLFLRALGTPPDQVPTTLAERVSAYRTITAARQVLLLVLVDNATSAEQVRPLIPTSTRSVVLVTSRLQQDGLFADGAHLVKVPPLPHADAVALLTRLIGEHRAAREPDALAELAQLCGRFPIALRVAAARLITRQRWSVLRVVTRLRDERSRLAALSHPTTAADSMTALFDWSYHYLEPHAAELYRLLGELPAAEFGVGVAAAVTGLTEPEVGHGLQVLVDASLLEEVDLDRYRFHDLVRLHARTQPDQRRYEVIPRAGAWYLQEMTRANLVIIPASMRWRVSPVAGQLAGEPAKFDTDGAALDWLARELPNVLAVLEEGAADRHDELAWQLCEALWELMLYRKPLPESLRAHELGITAAQRCGNPVAESRLRHQLGRVYLDLGQWDSAEAQTRHAIELARDAADRRTESAAVEQLGRVAQARGDVDTAIAHYRTSLGIEADLGIDRGVAARHRRIGDALLQAGRDADAQPHLQTALEMLTKFGDDKDQARVTLGLARIHARAGHQDTAVALLTTARQVLRRTGSAAYEANVLVALAEVAQLDGGIDQARGYLSEAVEVLQDLGGDSLDRALAALAALDHADPPRAEGNPGPA